MIIWIMWSKISNNLYIYQISDQFNGKPSNTIELNIRKGTLVDFLVVGSQDKGDTKFISIHYLNKINVLEMHTILDEASNGCVKHEKLKCKNKSDILFSFSNCKFRIDMITSDRWNVSFTKHQYSIQQFYYYHYY